MVTALREFGEEGPEDPQLIATGTQGGAREMRRAKGRHGLAEDDALAGGRTFDDVITGCSGYPDIGFVRFEPMKIHQAPYRAIVHEKMDGLLVAGRCVSATHVAASAGKSMGNCLAMGHAAGLAAALSVQRGPLPRHLPAVEWQQALRQDGVDLARGGEEEDPNMPA